jgi:phytoene synthase
MRAMPADTRAISAIWLSWWHETARIPLTIEDIGVAQTKLSWWASAIQEAATTGDAAHPLLQAMCRANGHEAGTSPPWPMWQDQLQALQDLLQQNRWMDEASLAHHLQRSTAQAAAGLTWLQGARAEATLDAARLWGMALRRHHMLARLGQDARAGWVHVPVDTLQRFEVKAHQLVKPQPGQTPAGWPALLAHLRQQADDAIAQARAATRALPARERQRLRPLAVLGAIYAAQTRVVANSGDAVLFQRLMLTPLRKSWEAQKQAWRLWWGA